MNTSIMIVISLAQKSLNCLNDQFFFGMTDFVFTFEQNLGSV